MTETDPLFQQIAADLRSSISSGAIRPGEKMPTLRAVAERWGSARETAAKAFRLLSDEGLIQTRPGRAGTIVAAGSKSVPLAIAIDGLSISSIRNIEVLAADTQVADSLGVSAESVVLVVRFNHESTASDPDGASGAE